MDLKVGFDLPSQPTPAADQVLKEASFPKPLLKFTPSQVTNAALPHAAPMKLEACSKPKLALRKDGLPQPSR